MEKTCACTGSRHVGSCDKTENLRKQIQQTTGKRTSEGYKPKENELVEVRGD